MYDNINMKNCYKVVKLIFLAQKVILETGTRLFLLKG